MYLYRFFFRHTGGGGQRFRLPLASEAIFIADCSVIRGNDKKQVSKEDTQ